MEYSHVRSLVEGFFSAASDLFVAYDRRGAVVAANPASISLFGLEDVDLSTWDARSTIQSEDVERAVDLLRQALRGVVPDGETVIRHVAAFGEVVISWKFFPVNDKDLVFAVGRDVTEAVGREREMRWLETLLDAGTDLVYVYAPDGKISYASEAVAHHGWEHGELVGRTAADFLHPDDRDELLRALATLTPGTEVSRRARVWGRSEHDWLDFDMKFILDPETKSVISLHRDVTDRLAHERQLVRTRRFFDAAAELFVVLDQDLRIADANQQAVTFLESDGIEPIGRAASEIWDADFADQLRSIPAGDELTLERPVDSFGRHLLMWTASRAPDGEVYLVGRDVTEERRLTARLRDRATTDELTGLSNRAELRQQLMRLLTDDRRVALLLLDLDQFKLVNDSLGHAAGDDLLRVVAERLRRSVRTGGMVGRLGGDEFVVLLVDADLEEAEGLAKRISRLLSDPVVIAGRELQVSASVGVAVSEPGSTADDLLREADTAAYHAKALGRNRYEIFDSALRDRAQEQLSLETGLRRALREQQFVLHYQAIRDLVKGHVVGAEALVRWQHPTEGLVNPGRFVDVAERTGVVVELGEQVLDLAMAQLSAWQRAGKKLSVTVNVSPRQLAHSGFPAMVGNTLEHHRIDPHWVVLEITETALMGSIDHTVSALHRLRSLGVRLAVDDFGTGHSSLGHLRDLPIDVVKLDRSFITDLGIDGANAAIASAVVELGRALDLQVIAEGVETEEVATRLVELGCGLAQGYLFHRPGPAASFEELTLPDAGTRVLSSDRR
ncbi:MAG: EAL domain-containing protein [Actinomycetota bacterium]